MSPDTNIICVIPRYWNEAAISNNCKTGELHRGHFHLTKKEVNELIRLKFVKWVQYPRNSKPRKGIQFRHGIVKLIKTSPLYGVSSKVGGELASSNESWARLMIKQILTRRRGI